MKEILEQIRKAKTYKEKMEIVEMLELRNLAEKKYPNYIIEKIRNAIEDEEFLRYLIEEEEKDTDEAPEEITDDEIDNGDNSETNTDNANTDSDSDDNDDDFGDFDDDSGSENDNNGDGDFDDFDDDSGSENDNDEDDESENETDDEDDGQHSDVLVLVNKLAKLIEKGSLNEVEIAAIKSLPKLLK